jgi:hypothetical protein
MNKDDHNTLCYQEYILKCIYPCLEMSSFVCSVRNKEHVVIGSVLN